MLNINGKNISKCMNLKQTKESARVTPNVLAESGHRLRYTYPVSL